MRTNLCGSIVPVFAAIVSTIISAETIFAAPPDDSKTQIKQTNVAKHGDLSDATSVAVSPDGRFIYSASWSKGKVTVFDRDTRTGLPIYFETFVGKNMNGGASFRLDPTGKLGITAAFRDRTVTLFQRDENSGSLKVVDIVRHGERGADDLNFAVESVFSNDSRFVYIGGVSAVTVFKLSGDKLVAVQTLHHLAIGGVRSLAVSPDDKFVYITGSATGAVVVLERDVDTGELKVIQVMQDNFSVDGGLPGVFAVIVSHDGKNVYTSSGRFGGSNAVCVFKRSINGKIEIIQKFIQAVDLTHFVGGNEIAVSPDDRIVAALASVSDNLVYFNRDLETGRLTLVEEVSVGSQANPGAAGLAFSPDGKNCYVADESSGELVTFGVQ